LDSLDRGLKRMGMKSKGRRNYCGYCGKKHNVGSKIAKTHSRKMYPKGYHPYRKGDFLGH
jgi:hypothetical protein